MTNYREVLRLDSLGYKHRQIADSLEITRPTVIKTLQRAKQKELTYSVASTMSDRDVAQKLYPQGEGGKPLYKLPDCEYVHRELQKPGVTIMLLWQEYADTCRQNGELPYQETQFRKSYHDWARQTDATMHINRKPGELMEVDWAGATAHVTDNITGESLEAYIFVAALPYSSYAYVEAFWNMEQSSWIAGHVNAYEYFGGVSRILVPDNLKTGVIKHTRTEIVLNKAYQDLAEHYGTAIIPTRVRTPKDKATVEGAVGIVTTYILAAIRNQQFFTLAELNEVIRKRLYDYNHKPFQKKDGSRATMFADERQFLLPLPKQRFELAEWRVATVLKNYHVMVDENYYSVPFEYIGRKADVRLTRNIVEVFFDHTRLASHVRITDKRGGYSTLEEHMPPNHKAFTAWTSDRFRTEAAQIGINTSAVIENILASNKVEKQAHHACLQLLKLADKHAPERLEAACAEAFNYAPKPTLRIIQTIMNSNYFKQDEQPAPSEQPHSFTRGSGYYSDGGED